MMFLELPTYLNLLIFAVSAAGVWFAGARLAYYADALADKTGWSKALLGLVLLAGVTELPELATTLTASLSGQAQLALTNLFGGVAMQTAILAFADLTLAKKPLTYFAPRSVLLLQCAALLGLLALTLAIVTLFDVAIADYVGLGPILLFCAYLFVVRLLKLYGHRVQWQPLETPDSSAGNREPEDSPFANWSLRRIAGALAGAALVVTGAGVVLAGTADALAAQTGLGDSFLGGTLLASSTSLPELSTTLAAVRIGAYSMAIANIFGSNMIMVALLLPADLAYTAGPILHEANPAAQFMLASGMLLTAVYLMGLIERRNRTVFGMGIDSLVVAVLYVVTLVGMYALR